MAIQTSRSAIEFMRRHGLRFTPRVPMPRLSVPGLHVEDIPLKRTQLDPNLMRDADGDPSPDRGRIDLWPPPQEVQTNATAAEESQ